MKTKSIEKSKQVLLQFKTRKAAGLPRFKGQEIGGNFKARIQENMRSPDKNGSRILFFMRKANSENKRLQHRTPATGQPWRTKQPKQLAHGTQNLQFTEGRADV